ncbi:hypothetical protein ACE1CI_10915 [Aerosakkonemataceae cyanobacterium BLCC-F50]|uniref:DUF262 domain-containing protein n=1 Tax=Floridaenema flaviceps BLCC-F50 TaxID=3153642 RepID=A0ABV4XNY7_9CYAN
MTTDIDILKDAKVNCYSVMVQLSVEDYLNMISKTFVNRGGLEGQRDTLKTTTAIRIRKRMVQDIEAGALIPPIVLGVVVSPEHFSKLDKLKNKDSFLELMQGIDSDSISIIDGMQRTTALHEALKKTDISKNQIRIEYWIASQVNSLTYRMLVLNTGQVPWNIRRQIEIVFLSIIKELKQKSTSVEIWEINDEKRSSSPGQFQANNIIELFLVFGARKEKIDLQERLADEFMRQDFIESAANANFTNIFYEVIDYLGKFDKAIAKAKDENSEEYFKDGNLFRKSQPACVGFVTAISLSVLGRPGSDHSPERQNEKWNQIKNGADQMLQRLSSLNSSEIRNFLDFPTLNELIGKKPAKSNEREFFVQAFRTLIEENFQVDNMTPCWRSY